MKEKNEWSKRLCFLATVSQTETTDGKIRKEKQKNQNPSKNVVTAETCRPKKMWFLNNSKSNLVFKPSVFYYLNLHENKQCWAVSQFLPQQEFMAVLFLHSPVLTGFPEVEKWNSHNYFSQSLYLYQYLVLRCPPEFSFIFSVLFALNIWVTKLGSKMRWLSLLHDFVRVTDLCRIPQHIFLPPDTGTVKYTACTLYNQSSDILL